MFKHAQADNKLTSCQACGRQDRKLGAHKLALSAGSERLNRKYRKLPEEYNECAR